MKKRGPKSLRRRPARRDPARFFHIFSEGKNTEPHYFNAHAKSLDRKTVKVKCYGPNGVPKSVAAAAIAFAKERGFIKNKRGRKLDSYEENDEVWAVFDCDEHPCYREAKQMCSDANLPFAYSDPCFELWLNLHFEESDAPCTRHQAQERSKELIEGYDAKSGKTSDFSKLIENVIDAEKRAERQRERRREEANEDGNPSTNVYELTRRIRRAHSSKDEI